MPVGDVREVTRSLLREWPLPTPDGGGDKNTRGSVLIVGGSAELPGAVILAAVAAMRAGAGRLRIACGRSIAPIVAGVVPEARVIALPETDGGDIAPSAARRLAELLPGTDALLIGPGMNDPKNAANLLRGFLPSLGDTTLVVDAAAHALLSEDPAALRGFAAVITPHAVEMGHVLGRDPEEISKNAQSVAVEAAKKLEIVTALKGSETFIAAPNGRCYCNKAGNIGLATSGSGDTLAGIVTGLSARGADPLQAAVWGVSLHARAGDKLAKTMGPLGFLARELLAEIPGLMRDLGPTVKRS
ncbi:MAG: NAD(P)H-hydrate dehydratase [Capsulimonas sp.]|nr:NAD(P)H-hydrate dehydratase [Capsulimonas sp.]